MERIQKTYFLHVICLVLYQIIRKILKNEQKKQVKNNSSSLKRTHSYEYDSNQIPTYKLEKKLKLTKMSFMYSNAIETSLNYKVESSIISRLQIQYSNDKVSTIYLI